jgi:hypothetical protein
MTLRVREDAEGDSRDALDGLDDPAAQPLGLLERGLDVVDADEEEHLIGIAL